MPGFYKYSVILKVSSIELNGISWMVLHGRAPQIFFPSLPF